MVSSGLLGEGMTEGRAMSLSFHNVSGNALAEFIPALAQLRIRVFRDYPYLYDGDEAYEKRYLQKYMDSPRSIIVLAVDGARVVGASSAIPLIDETGDVQQPFLDAGMNPAEIFYCGESVMLPEYRGRGAGVRFFNEREEHAKMLGGFRYSCFCAVDRPEDHPRRPQTFIPLDGFWRKRGYRQQPQLQTTFCWQDLDEQRESDKPMIFWMKEL